MFFQEMAAKILAFCWFFFTHLLLSLFLSGLSLVVGLVLYISSINDEVMNRPREPEQFFNYRYGWSFAFAASSFLLKEVRRWNFSPKYQLIWLFCMSLCLLKANSSPLAWNSQDVVIFLVKAPMTRSSNTLQSMQDLRVRSLCIMNVNLQMRSILVITWILHLAQLIIVFTHCNR